MIGFRAFGRRKISFLTLLSLAALVTACSSGGTSTSTSTTTNGKASPFVVGVIGSFTGADASVFGTFPQAIQAWASWTNAHGGVAGHPVDLIVKDDGLVTATSITDAHELISQDHAAVLLSSSTAEISWAPYAAAEKVPVIDLESLSLNKYFFASGTPLDPTGSYGAYAEAKKSGGKSVAFFYCNEIAQCSQAVPSAKSDAKQAGMQFAYAGSYSDSEPNYTSQCIAARAAKANVINVFGSPADQIEVARSCVQVGYKFILVSSSANFTNAWLAYSQLNGAIEDSPDFPTPVDTTPATKAFHAAMAQYAPSTVKSTGYGEPDAVAWTMGQEAASALELAHVNSDSPITSATILNGLFAMNGDTLDGLSPPLTFTQQANENTKINCWFTQTIANQQFTAPDGLTLSCV